LNQMNENAQNIIARKTPPYILILVFTEWQVSLVKRANLRLIIVNIRQAIKKLQTGT
jgi:hypothetical protein